MIVIVFVYRDDVLGTNFTAIGDLDTPLFNPAVTSLLLDGSFRKLAIGIT